MNTPDQIGRVRALKNSQLLTTERYLNWGYPKLNDALMGFTHGLFVVAAPPNIGKSSLVLAMYSNLIINNDDILVIDFTLDDSFEDRVSNTIASRAKVPINWVKNRNLPEVSTVAQLEIENQYRLWGVDSFQQKLDIRDETDFDNRCRVFENIKRHVQDMRQQHPDKKLVVVIDGFHNIVVDNPAYQEEYNKHQYLSAEIKTLSAETKAIFIATAHTPKKSMRRGLDQDAVKGGGGITFDAKVIATLYSDYKVNRGAASVFFQSTLPHDPGAQVTLPIIELDVVKNKTSSFTDILFYRFFTEYAYIEECEEQYQAYYKDLVYGKQP